MPSREQVDTLRHDGLNLEQIARALRISAGQAFMIETGLPADGSDVPEKWGSRQPADFDGSSQSLVNPPTSSPSYGDVVTAWLQRRSAGDAQMTKAAAQRTAEPPAPEGPESSDVVTILGRDHNQVLNLVQQFEAIPGTKKGATPVQSSRRASIMDMIRLRLSQHEVGEEQIFWPAVRDALPGGNDLATTAREQENEAKKLLQDLESLEAEEFDRTATQLMTALRRHVAFEDMVFRQVDFAIDRGQREQLGNKVERAKRRAPTRPHPLAPADPAASRVGAPLLAASDHARDAVLGRPADRLGKGNEELQTLKGSGERTQ